MRAVLVSNMTGMRTVLEIRGGSHSVLFSLILNLVVPTDWFLITFPPRHPSPSGVGRYGAWIQFWAHCLIQGDPANSTDNLFGVSQVNTERSTTTRSDSFRE